MQRGRTRFLTIGFTLASLIGANVCRVEATPYAANVRNTSGANWEFVLNEGADNVTVLRNGANPVNLGALTAGRHTFDMTGFSSFEIKVQKSAPTAWTSISDPSNLFDDFTFPTGVAVNKSASNLAYFGAVYVANSNAATTTSGRTVGDGIYGLTADMKGVNFTSGFAAVADPNDATQAKAPGFEVASGGTASPNRISLDAGGNVIVGDWSDTSGGIKYAARDLATGGRVLAGTDFNGSVVADGNNTGPAGGVYSDQMDQFGRLPLHGSVVSRPYTTGTVGVDLTLYTMDEDLDIDLAVPNNDTNSIWRYNVGAATEYQALAPTVVVKSTSIPPVSTGGPNFIGAFGGGVRADMFYDATFNKWYITNGRSSGLSGNGASVIVVSANPDGSQASAPVVNWSSRQFSVDNNLDADPADADINDIFRRVGQAVMSPDHKFLILHRTGSDTAHNGIGVGDVLVLPLDANGIPMLNVSAGAVTNVVDFSEIGGQGGHTTGNSVEFDAAGNLYVANSSVTAGNIGQLVQVFSPGGNWVASTKSDGTFALSPFTSVGVAGDYNNNGVVDAADYVVWRNAGPTDTLPNDSTPGAVTSADYDVFKANFGKTAGSGSGAGNSAAVPEPASIALVALGLFVGMGRRKRTA